MPDGSEPRSERVVLRMTPTAKRTLQHAAAASNKSVSEFLLESGLNAAVDALVDRRLFLLDDAQWEEFTAALARPPKQNARLRKSLAYKHDWEI